jgi:hypothetical protein
MLICLHGLTIQCTAPSAALEAQLVRPFGLFLAESGEPEVQIEVIATAPPYEQFPVLEASFSTPRNIVYDAADCKVVDYFGSGATVENKGAGSFTIYGEDANFLQEAFYLLVLSIFGQYCDRNGMLRVHAMALSYADYAILMPIPPGGGKSTMAVAMLQEEGFRLISDDEPIVSQSGAILPFALRIGTLDKAKAEAIPAEFVYSIDRMEFGLKYFIDVRYWENRLEHRALDKVIYMAARRVLNGTPSIEEVPKYRVLKSLFRDAIVGVGLYQGLEFMFSHSAWRNAAQLATLMRRSVVAWKMLRRARTYRFTLSGDVAENRRILGEFARGLEPAAFSSPEG